MTTPRRRKYRVLIEFDGPSQIEFLDIRDYITVELESSGGRRHPDDPLFHGLGEVKVSKPIVPWRDPARTEKPPVRIVAPWEKKAP